MKILVTGCMGFIGSNLVPFLLNKGIEVVGFDNNVNPSIMPTDRMKAASGDNWANFKFYECDIRELAVMRSICANELPTMIIHLAALGSVPRSFENPSLWIDVNERGFSNILCLASYFHMNRVVFASSSSVYGEVNSSSKIEGQEGETLSPYALTKKANEELARIWCQNIPLKYIGLRFFNVYGPGQIPDSAYSAVIPKFINNPVIKIYGDGEAKRDFTYVDDVCSCIIRAIFSNKTNFVCNVGTGNQTSLNELAQLIKEDGQEIKYVPERQGDVKLSKASTFRAKDFLGFEAKTDIASGIDKTKEFYRLIEVSHGRENTENSKKE